MADFTPTAEQQQAVDLAVAGRSIAIQALAGTGKTSTLTLVGEALAPKRVQYIAFNHDIVKDAGSKFSSNVQCNTAHSLARRATPRDLTSKLDHARRQPSWEIADAIGLTDGIWVENWEGQRRQLTKGFLAGVVMRAVLRWCQTADPEPTYQHVPAIPGLDAPREKGKRHSGLKKGAGWEQVARALAPYLNRAWQDLNDPHGSLRYDHAHYLKRWQLSNPKIAADVILWDEAQDASPVMMDVIAKQTHAQVIWVGDSQQEIYAWAGAVNAMEQISSDDTTFLTKSFRFGQAVADEANRVLAMLGVEQQVIGFEQVSSTVAEIEQADAILCRSNARVVQHLFAELDAGRRPAIVGGGKEIASFCRAAEKLMQGRRVEHAELACFENWSEVEDYVEQDAQGSDLALMVKIINEFGIVQILDMIGRIKDARDPHVLPGRDYDVAVSTAHKAKGREWNRVKLADDFPAEVGKTTAEELRLLYVAVTRAKLQLDITAVALLSGALEPAYATTGTELMKLSQGDPVAEHAAIQVGPGSNWEPEPPTEAEIQAALEREADERAAWSDAAQYRAGDPDLVTPGITERNAEIVKAAEALVAASDRDFDRIFEQLQSAVGVKI